MSGQSDTEPIFFQIYMGSLEFGFRLFVSFFWKSVQNLFTDRALPTIRCIDKILGKVSPSPYSPKITVAYRELRVYFPVQNPPFIVWTWTAKMTLSLHVDLVLSDAGPPVKHNLLNRCCHFAYGDAAMWLKCIRHPKNAIFTQNFAMSVTPASSFVPFSWRGQRCGLMSSFIIALGQLGLFSYWQWHCYVSVPWTRQGCGSTSSSTWS